MNSYTSRPFMIIESFNTCMQTCPVLHIVAENMESPITRYAIGKEVSALFPVGYATGYTWIRQFCPGRRKAVVPELGTHVVLLIRAGDVEALMAGRSRELAPVAALLQALVEALRSPQPASPQSTASVASSSKCVEDDPLRLNDSWSESELELTSSPPPLLDYADTFNPMGDIDEGDTSTSTDHRSFDPEYVFVPAWVYARTPSKVMQQFFERHEQERFVRSVLK